MKKLISSCFLVVVAAVIFSGCGIKKLATATIGRIATDGSFIVESEEDLDLARSSTPSLIITLEVFAQGNPKDLKISTLLAKSYGQYAFGFLEEDLLRYKNADKDNYKKSFDRADLFYRRGLKYGLAGLWPNKTQEQVFRTPFDKFETDISKLGRGRTAAAFWAAFCWGNLINMHRDEPDAFIDLPKVEALVKKVIKLEPEYYYGSAHAFLASIAASRPKMLGGDPNFAKQEFTAALKVENRYLMTKLLYAQYYAVQIQDVKLFESLLADVEGADASKFAEQRLANELAKRRAKLLLAKKNQYF